MNGHKGIRLVLRGHNKGEGEKVITSSLRDTIQWDTCRTGLLRTTWVLFFSSLNFQTFFFRLLSLAFEYTIMKRRTKTSQPIPGVALLLFLSFSLKTVRHKKKIWWTKTTGARFKIKLNTPLSRSAVIQSRAQQPSPHFLDSHKDEERSRLLVCGRETNFFPYESESSHYPVNTQNGCLMDSSMLESWIYTRQEALELR